MASDDIGFAGDADDTAEGPGGVDEDAQDEEDRRQRRQTSDGPDQAQDQQTDATGQPGGPSAGPSMTGDPGPSPAGERDFSGLTPNEGVPTESADPPVESDSGEPSRSATDQSGQTRQQSQQQTQTAAEPTRATRARDGVSTSAGREQASDLADMGRRQGGPELAAIQAGDQTVREELRERAIERAERAARNEARRTEQGEFGAPGDEAAGTAATSPGGERARDTMEATRQEAIRSQAAEQLEEQLAAEGRDVDLTSEDITISETAEGERRATLTESGQEKLGSGERFGGEGVVESTLRDINEAVVDTTGDVVSTLVSDRNAGPGEQARDQAIVGAAEGVAQLNPAGLAVTGIEAGEFVLEGGSLVLTGRGQEFTDRTEAAATDIVTNVQETATTSPQRFGGQLIGSALGTTGALKAASRFAGPTATKATATAIQPGEEVAASVLSRTGRLTGITSRLDGARTRLSGTRGRPIEAELADATKAREFIADTRADADLEGLSKADRDAAGTSEVDEAASEVAEAPRDPSLSGRARGRRRAGKGGPDLLRPGTGRAKGVQGLLDEIEAKRQRVESEAGDANVDDVTVREAERRRTEAVDPRARVSETDLEPTVTRPRARVRTEAATTGADQLAQQTAEVSVDDLRGEVRLDTRSEPDARADTRLEERLRADERTRTDIDTRLETDTRLDQRTRTDSRQETRQEQRRETRLELRTEARTRNEAEARGDRRRRGREAAIAAAEASFFDRVFEASVTDPDAVISGAAVGDLLDGVEGYDE